MYRKHFALTRHPFGNEIEPDALFASNSTRELDVRLQHLLDLRGIGLVTGDSGSGKTCSSRKVLAALHSGLYRVLYVSLSTGNVMDELPDYLTHRLRLAGTELPLFEPPAQEALFQATSGLPRKLNLLAHHALLAASLARAKSVTSEHVQAALPEVA